MGLGSGRELRIWSWKYLKLWYLWGIQMTSWTDGYDVRREMRAGDINQHVLCRLSHVDFPGRTVA